MSCQGEKQNRVLGYSNQIVYGFMASGARWGISVLCAETFLLDLFIKFSGTSSLFFSKHSSSFNAYAVFSCFTFWL